MSYTPTTWATGDTITASAMNKIENGIANAGSALIVQMSYVNGNLTLDKTIQELYDATMAGTPVYLMYTYGDWSGTYSENSLAYMFSVFKYGSDFRAGFIRQSGYGTFDNKNGIPCVGAVWFGASSASAYPTYLSLVKTLAFA